MRFLLPLGFLQTICLLYLILNRAGVPLEKVEHDVLAAPAGRGSAMAAGGQLEEERIRQIIREEFQLLFATENFDSIDSDSAHQVSGEVTPQQDSGYDENQKEYIAQQIAYHRSTGKISSRDMQRLQLGIARLSAQDRREMMSRLVQALNAGEIDGQL